MPKLRTLEVHVLTLESIPRFVKVASMDNITWDISNSILTDKILVCAGA